MITDGVQGMLANNLLPRLTAVHRRRLVEALASIAEDAAPSGGGTPAAHTPSAEARACGASPSRESLRFVYRAVRENGRRVAKRTPQVTDSRYWSFMLDRAG